MRTTRGLSPLPRRASRQPHLRAFLVARFRHYSGSLTRAAFLSARNDALANVEIIGAGLLTAATLSLWPDLIVGLAIAALNADAAREAYLRAKREKAGKAEA